MGRSEAGILRGVTVTIAHGGAGIRQGLFPGVIHRSRDQLLQLGEHWVSSHQADFAPGWRYKQITACAIGSGRTRAHRAPKQTSQWFALNHTQHSRGQPRAASSHSLTRTHTRDSSVNSLRCTNPSRVRLLDLQSPTTSSCRRLHAVLHLFRSRGQ